MVEGRKEEEQTAMLADMASGGTQMQPEVRMAAILLLGSHPNRDAVRALLENLSFLDPWWLRSRAGDEPKTPDSLEEYERLGMFASVGKKRIGNVETPAVWALRQIGPFAIPQILEYMNTATQYGKIRAAAAIYLMFPDDAAFQNFLGAQAKSLPPEMQAALVRSMRE